jgi:HlyD family secretion protein
MKKRVLVGSILLMVVIAAVVLYRSAGTHDTGTLLLSGNVEVTETNIGFKIPGRVISLVVDEGARVGQGDKLAVLDSAELESIASQNRATVKYAEAELEKARKDYDRYVVLVRQEVISPQQMDAAKSAFEVAVSRFQQAKAALSAAQDRLRDTVIYAPVASVVLRRNVELGETVGAGVAVFTLGDLENPWIKVYVKETKLGLVKLGQKASVYVDSYPGKNYDGTVTYLSSEAEFTPKNVQTQEERVKLVFGVKVSVKNQNDELKPGMPADVKINIR